MARGRRRRGRDASNAKMVGGKKKKKKGLSHAALPLGSKGERRTGFSWLSPARRRLRDFLSKK